jgi:hypothetical protein
MGLGAVDALPDLAGLVIDERAGETVCCPMTCRERTSRRNLQPGLAVLIALGAGLTLMVLGALAGARWAGC